MIWNSDPQAVKAVYSQVVKALSKPEYAAAFLAITAGSKGGFIYANVADTSHSAPPLAMTLENGDLVTVALKVISHTPAAELKRQAAIRAQILTINPEATEEQISTAARALTGKR